MKNIPSILIAVLATLFFASCEVTEECDCIPKTCNMNVLVSADAYLNAANDFLSIDSVVMTNGCMLVTFGSSGCDGSTWEIKLIDSGEIMESYPEQRKLRLSLKNQELCDAYFTKQISFNIEELQVSSKQVVLHIDGYDYPVLYEY